VSAPPPARRDPARLEHAAVRLQVLCRHLLGDGASEHLARIADSPADAEGALRFGCLLDLARKPDGALWWWQFAAGAGNVTAAYCLHLLHTRRGDLRDAAHWWYQHRALGPDDLDLPPSQTYGGPDTSAGVLQQAVDRLRVDEAAGEFHHPDRHLADQIEALVNRS
jgi:TPR repeat protein